MRLVPFGLIALLGVLVGCTAGGPMRSSDAPSLDSLRAENAKLRDQNRALRDSLRFRQDLQTGQYYRDLRTLQDRLNRLTYEVHLLRDGGLTVALLPVDVLFATADSLSEAGVERLDTIATQLRHTYPNRTVRVEGHADSTPLGESLKAQFQSNRELSCARATAVTQHLITRTPLDRSQFVAVGYGASRPRASNETAGGRRRNRRVRIAVLPLPKDYSRPFETAW